MTEHIEARLVYFLQHLLALGYDSGYFGTESASGKLAPFSADNFRVVRRYVRIGKRPSSYCAVVA
jgi:hypothetical protein